MKKIRIKKDIIKFFKVLLVCYLLAHIICFYFYKPMIEPDEMYKISKGLQFTKTLNLDLIKVNDYLTFHSMKIKNDFQNFEKKDDNLKNYDKYFDSNNNGLIIGMDETKITLLKNNEIFYSENKDFRINNKNVTKYLKQNNIKNDMDLIRHVQKAKTDSYNIFSSIKTMKEKYLLSYIIYTSIPTANELYKIVGDYGGYAFVLDDFVEVSIVTNGKRYIYSFIGREHFTDDYINKLLNTIVLE